MTFFFMYLYLALDCIDITPQNNSDILTYSATCRVKAVKLKIVSTLWSLSANSLVLMLCLNVYSFSTQDP